MRRDSTSYYLFQTYPTILFELLPNPPANAANYRFDSVAVKEPKFEIDGVFLPPETETPGVVYLELINLTPVLSTTSIGVQNLRKI